MRAAAGGFPEPSTQKKVLIVPIAQWTIGELLWAVDDKIGLATKVETRVYVKKLVRWMTLRHSKQQRLTWDVISVEHL